jgi:putative glutamine amidotransferase
MGAPLIGLTAARTKNAQGLPMNSVMEAYLSSVVDAGGSPILIPVNLPGEQLHTILSHLDGVLFTGGGDIHPDRYGGEDHPTVNLVDLDRDRVELSLFDQATQAGMPFFGICRGLQVVNVACGGSLYTDIQGLRPGALKHDYFPDWPRQHLAHPIEVNAGSRLAEILGGTNVEVNSLHHQGVERLGPSLKPVAYAPDGIIEAVELPGYPFGLAVQWHPEWLQAYEPMRALFKAFVEAARAGQQA